MVLPESRFTLFGTVFQGNAVAILETSTDPNSKEFKANAAQMRALVEELNKRRAEAALGGGEKSRERHVKRGKLLPRERVMRLIDPGSPFLELSPLAANGLYGRLFTARASSPASAASKAANA